MSTFRFFFLFFFLIFLYFVLDKEKRRNKNKTIIKIMKDQKTQSRHHLIFEFLLQKNTLYTAPLSLDVLLARFLLVFEMY